MNASEEPDWQSVERHAVSLIDKGHELQRLGCDKEALASFDKAVTICRAISDKSDPVSLVLAQALDNKGRALMDLKRLAEAIPCFDEAIQVHKEIVRGDGTEQDVRETAISVMNKGLALMRLGRNEEALACFEEALDAFRTCQSGEDIARALAKSNPALRAILKKAGFLTRDSRMKERKKYGQKGARKRFQFSKR